MGQWRTEVKEKSVKKQDYIKTLKTWWEVMPPPPTPSFLYRKEQDRRASLTVRKDQNRKQMTEGLHDLQRKLNIKSHNDNRNCFIMPSHKHIFVCKRVNKVTGLAQLKKLRSTNPETGGCLSRERPWNSLSQALSVLCCAWRPWNRLRHLDRSQSWPRSHQEAAQKPDVEMAVDCTIHGKTHI